MTGCVKILAVDDCPAVRRVLEALFTAAGCHLVTAASAREALRILRVFRPNVILTDYNMPGVDGRGFVALVRRIPSFRTIPIFVLSSEEAPEFHLAMQRAGATAWFSKPIDPAPLMEAVVRRPCFHEPSPGGADRRSSPPEAFPSAAS
jgi:two-component system chemotaxis response regulator CheY